MNKKILSMVLAIGLTFGSAASLPQGVFTDNVFITASADESYGLFEYTITDTDSAMITKYNGKADDVIIPDTLGGKPVKLIGQNAFYKNENIVTVKVPNSLVNIGNNAFAYCSKLKKLENLKNTKLTYINSYAFYECGNLQMTQSDFPSTPAFIGSFAFYNCKKLEGIDLNKADTIFSSAFEGCESLTEISIPKVKEGYFGDKVFKGCKNLQSITLPKDIKTLTNGLFQGCAKLDLSIPAKVTYIGDNCFEGCESFKHIVVPSGVTYIGENALGWKYFKEGLASGWITKVDTLYCYPKSKKITEEYADGYFKVLVVTCNHHYEGYISKKSTCTEKGEATYVCTQCLDSYTTEIPANGHSWSKWKVTTPATEEHSGTEKRTCDRCGAEETKTFAYAGDEYLLGDVNNDGIINVTDITKIAAHIKNKKKLNEEEQKRADVNNDGRINVTDITKIAALIKGKKLLN